jgi:hypothetical protein
MQMIVVVFDQSCLNCPDAQVVCQGTQAAELRIRVASFECLHEIAALYYSKLVSKAGATAAAAAASSTGHSQLHVPYSQIDNYWGSLWTAVQCGLLLNSWRHIIPLNSAETGGSLLTAVEHRCPT